MSRKASYPRVDDDTDVSCSQCNRMRPASDFYKDTRKLNGLGSWCKDCNRGRSKVEKGTFGRPDDAYPVICRRCCQQMPAELFYTNSTRSSGLQSECIECCLERRRAYSYDRVHDGTLVRCSKCRVEKRAVEFSSDRRHRNGLDSKCKSCKNSKSQ